MLHCTKIKNSLIKNFEDKYFFNIEEFAMLFRKIADWMFGTKKTDTPHPLDGPIRAAEEKSLAPYKVEPAPSVVPAVNTPVETKTEIVPPVETKLQEVAVTPVEVVVSEPPVEKPKRPRRPKVEKTPEPVVEVSKPKRGKKATVKPDTVAKMSSEKESAKPAAKKTKSVAVIDLPTTTKKSRK